MSLTVVTGWSPKGWVDYAHRFLRTFDEFWPKGTKLVTYVEDPRRVMWANDDTEFRRLELIPGWEEFYARHKDNPVVQGRTEYAQSWKDKERAAGYSFRFDALKFARQGFIPWHASAFCDTSHMLWLDADVVTLRKIPPSLIESLLPPGKLLAYLGREPKHSEIGFQLYRMHPDIGRMLKMFRDLYATDSFLKLAEWHSAFVFDRARFATLTPPDMVNLTPPGASGHVWEKSVLAPYLRHDKGDRKYRNR